MSQLDPMTSESFKESGIIEYTADIIEIAISGVEHSEVRRYSEGAEGVYSKGEIEEAKRDRAGMLEK